MVTLASRSFIRAPASRTVALRTTVRALSVGAILMSYDAFSPDAAQLREPRVMCVAHTFEY